MYLAFKNEDQRNKVYNAILEKMDENCATEKNIVECLQQWVNGKMSNFDYLMHLNSAAYRSFADLSQYDIRKFKDNNYWIDILYSRGC